MVVDHENFQAGIFEGCERADTRLDPELLISGGRNQGDGRERFRNSLAGQHRRARWGTS